MKTGNVIYRCNRVKSLSLQCGLLEESEFERPDDEPLLMPFDIDFFEIEEENEFTSIQEK